MITWPYYLSLQKHADPAGTSAQKITLLVGGLTFF
jgi:hypothetical protein